MMFTSSGVGGEGVSSGSSPAGLIKYTKEIHRELTFSKNTQHVL